MSMMTPERSGMRSRALLTGLLLAGVVGLPTLAALAAPLPARKPAPAKAPVAKPVARAAVVQVGEKVRFNRDIRPILSDNCFACHGPDKNTRIAGFRLDVRTEALNRGVIVPGNAAKSSLITRVFTKEQGRLMPPVASHKTLSDGQKELLKRWIAQGAEYEAHWAYISPTRPAVPAIADKRYLVRNPIDAFIAEKLLTKRILPSGEADRRTLIRRVSLDLTGLPPAPERVEAFVNDQSPNAYEKVVDELLASPHYGERMASPWLDVVRYADTVGFHGDQNQNAWPYRDYVVDSFNKNKPYDRFTMEQIAGDLLPDATDETRTATCFNRLNMMTREGGAQPKEYLAKYSADRVRTVGMTFLGSTFGCAECHDHKYDPISQKDFYSLAAFFGDLKQWGVYADYGYTPNPDLKGYNNDYPFPPEIKVRSAFLEQKIKRGEAKIASIAAGSAQGLAADDAPAHTAFMAWRKAAGEFAAKHPDGWSLSFPVVTGPAKAKVEHDVLPDASASITDPKATTVSMGLRSGSTWVASMRVELLPSDAHGKSIFRKEGPDPTLTLSMAVNRAGGKAEAVRFRHAAADKSLPRYRNGSEIVGVHGGWKLSAGQKAEPHVSVWVLESPVRLNPGEDITVTFPNLAAARVRVALSPFVPQPGGLTFAPGLAQALTQAEGMDPLSVRSYLLGTAWNSEAFAQARAAEADILEAHGGMTPVMVSEATTPTTLRVLPRGNWQDESGPVVQPSVPHFLPGYEANPGRRLSRLDLAKWMVSKENPLTARVFVNRVWKQFFGNGLSGLVEDLGGQGEWPTHAELLDWLSVEFRDGGHKTIFPDVGSTYTPVRAWDVKHLVKLIVTSATYRQSSSLRPELQESDPNNRLLASQNPRRLEAEFVRDNALAIAGLLNLDAGGPPVKPYQPDGYYANIQFPDRPYAAETDDNQWRRALYVHWQRTFLLPSFVNFDAPSREDCIAARTAANTPQQALTLLNDPTFVEAARAFGARVLTGAKTDDARLELAFRQALGRTPKPAEKQSLLAFVEKMRIEYRQRPEDAAKLQKVGIAPVPADVDPVELAAWTSVCRVMLNLQETITRY